MKKIFWITFFIFLFFICNIGEIDSEDYSHLLEDREMNSTVRIKVNINSNELVKILKDSEVYLISVKTDNPFIKKSIVVDGDTLEKQVYFINERVSKILIDKGLSEEGIYYKLNGINITSIKVFGRNESIYNLTTNL